jgi:TrmH family RNA methyltransferase
LANAAGARIYELATGVIERVASTVTPQPVLAVFPMLDVPFEQSFARGSAAGGAPAPGAAVRGELVVVMADVRDPGNAGTVIRTADAAGVSAVVCCGGTVDPYNPKTVRASAGSIFHVPIVLGDDPSAVLSRLGASGFRRLGAVVRDGVDYATVDWSSGRIALVLGNEAWGLAGGEADAEVDGVSGGASRGVSAAASGDPLPLDGLVGIPMAGRAESLNVGMACAVVCFEALRQRRTTMPR